MSTEMNYVLQCMSFINAQLDLIHSYEQLSNLSFIVNPFSSKIDEHKARRHSYSTVEKYIALQ